MFIIPMAGNSSRFFKSGFTVPKYQLELWGAPMFDWVLKSFEKYHKTDEFRFVVRSDFQAADFVAARCNYVGIKNFSIIELDYETKGQADTVRLGLSSVNIDEPIYIFNADSFHLNFTKPEIELNVGGVLDVFEGEGLHWSFVEPDDTSPLPNRVKRTTEKVRISNLCSDGMYIFSSANQFLEAFNRGAEMVSAQSGEIYIAPLYNELIAQGIDVVYRVIDSSQLYFCGTPDEYQYLIQCGKPMGG